MRTWLAVAGLTLATSVAPAQPTLVRTVSVSGSDSSTFVLLSGMVGGIGGFQRLETRLLAGGHRVITIDAYAMSVDSTDVSFAAMARRVERVLAEHSVTDARLVGHAHGGGVMLRLAAMAPQRFSELYLLDVGALSSNHTKVFSRSLRLVPFLARIPGGRTLIRNRFVSGLRQNSGRQEWLDSATTHAYTSLWMNDVGRAVSLAFRLRDSQEPESLHVVVARIRQPITLILGDAPHDSRADSSEITALAPLGPLLTVHRLAGVGHFPHEEVPDEVVRLLLARRERTGGGSQPPRPPKFIPLR